MYFKVTTKINKIFGKSFCKMQENVIDIPRKDGSQKPQITLNT